MNYKLEPLDYAEIRKELEKELPALPESIETSHPPAEPQEPKIIGDPLPKPPPEKNKMKPRIQKRQKKKDEIQRPIRWAGFPDPDQPSSFDYITKEQDRIDFQNPLVNDFQKASMSDIDVAPCLIKEVII